jgi:hypothetical protein
MMRRMIILERLFAGGLLSTLLCTPAVSQGAFNFTNAVTLQEIATSGRVVTIRGTRSSAIVDDRSRLVVHFEKQLLNSALDVSAANPFVSSVRDSVEYGQLATRLRELRTARAASERRFDQNRTALRTRRESAYTANERELRESLGRYQQDVSDPVSQELRVEARRRTQRELVELAEQQRAALDAFDDSTASTKGAFLRSNDAKEDSLREQMRGVVMTALTEWPGFEFSIEARVVPKQGPAYDLPVQGFTTVAIKEDTTHRSADSTRVAGGGGGSTITRSQEKNTTIEAYRLNARILGGQESSPDVHLSVLDELTDGVIELGGLNLGEGDRVLVTVTNHYPRDRSITWFLNVRDIGVHTQTSPSALLVHRVGEMPLQSGTKDLDTLELRSVLEPAPGASFQLSFTSRSPGWNFLHPALGINGTFVDFRKDKSIEVGLGPVLTLFDGILQASYGWNLSSNRRTHYWSIGLGFLDLASRLSGGAKGGTDTSAAGAATAGVASAPPKS